MHRILAILKTAFKNKVFLFIFSRYGTYAITFLNTLFIAAFLGPFYLGIWGFITLVTQYMNHLSFGIADSVTAILSINKGKEFYSQKIIGTAVTMLLVLSLVAIVLFGINDLFDINIGGKYNFSTYAPLVVFIGILVYFNTLFSQIFRVYGRLFEIAFSQTIFPVCMLLAIIFFRNENLLWALVIANFLSFFVTFILYLVRTPIKIRPIFIFSLFKRIQIKGWHLFVYNASFYFIVISTRSLVSVYYPVEEFGYFTFAFSLANVILLLLQAFAYLIYPKMLNRFAVSNDTQNIQLMSQVRDAYVTTSHLLVHSAILFFPVFLIFFPQYILASEAFKLISLTVVLYTNSFGYSGLLIAKGFEKKLGRLSFSACLINIIVALILIKLVNVPFTLVILATMISYLIYVLFLGILGRKMLNLNTSINEVLKDMYPLRLIAPFTISLAFILFSVPNGYFIVPVIAFLLLNFKVLVRLKKVVRSILVNPNFINI